MQTLRLVDEYGSGSDVVAADYSLTKSQLRQLYNGWISRALNSTVCCLCLILLSPAIVAVWIAIRRSTHPLPAASSRSQSNPIAAALDEPELIAPMRFVLKPERLRRIESLRSDSMSETALASQAAG